MVGSLGLWRILLAFCLVTTGGLAWLQGLQACDPSRRAIAIAGLANNAGMLVFGMCLIVLTMFGRSIPCKNWRATLLIVLLLHLSRSTCLEHADQVWVVFGYSMMLAMASTLFLAQVTALAISSADDFSRDRRGGSLGYGIGFSLVSLELPWSACIASVSCSLLLAFMSNTVSANRAKHDPAPSRDKHSGPNSGAWGLIVATIVLFSLLAASARIYESFITNLLGTVEGVVGVGCLVVLEIMLLPQLKRLNGQAWVMFAMIAWLIAYALLLCGGLVQILAVAFISVNCCGQTVLQERLQKSSSSGQAHSQAAMSIGATMIGGVVSSLAFWWIETQQAESSIWILGLTSSAISLSLALPILWTASRCGWFVAPQAFDGQQQSPASTES